MNQIGTGVSTGYGSNFAMPAAPPPETLPRLDVVQNGLGYAINSTDSILSRLTKLADRFGGPVPQEVSKTGGAEPSQPPVVVGLERSTEQLNMRLEYIFKQIERLEKF